MKLVIDTNIIISALIKKSITRELLFSPRFDLYSPEFVYLEIEEHYDEILKKSKMEPYAFRTVLDEILSRIIVVPLEEYKPMFSEALEIMKDIDEDDTAFLALALLIRQDGIWSNDPDFRLQKKVRVWTTKDLIELKK